MDYRIVNKIFCVLERGYAYFKDVFKLDVQKQWTGLT